MERVVTDTIAAPATGLQISAIGIIRISGPYTEQVLRRLFPGIVPVHRVVKLGWLIDPDSKERVDHAQVVFYAAPKSYTGEDMAELFTHGSPVVMDRVMRILGEQGVRYARAGEFTERAVVNGKLDLLQAEAINDLIEAPDMAAARLAVRGVEGKTGKFIKDLQDQILNVLSWLYAVLDFPEDDAEVPTSLPLLHGILDEIKREVRDFRYNRVIKEGVRVVIAGPPNVGKSTLFNRIVGSEMAITAPLPGTTRDIIRERLLIGGVPVLLIDTGGIGQTEDALNERVQRLTATAVQDADILVMVDAIDAESRFENPVVSAPVIKVTNKADLMEEAVGVDGMVISAATGQGMDEFLHALQERIMLIHKQAAMGTAHIAGERQKAILQRVAERIEQAITLLEAQEPAELATLELETAIADIGELTGAQVSEEVLDRIFSRFCIGK